ncbi:hypothetical protein HG530_003055 [Fusarium avenaceum]|nr:hypothetical protein HG530_003055 [Fusarium avenaceum]
MLLSRKQIPAITGNGIDVCVLNSFVCKLVSVAPRFSRQEVAGKSRAGKGQILVKLEGLLCVFRHSFLVKLQKFIAVYWYMTTRIQVIEAKKDVGDLGIRVDLDTSLPGHLGIVLEAKLPETAANADTRIWVNQIRHLLQNILTTDHADFIARVGTVALDGTAASLEHLDGMVDFVFGGAFVFEESTEFGRVVDEILEIDFDSFVLLFALHGNVDSGRNIGKSGADRARLGATVDTICGAVL